MKTLNQKSEKSETMFLIRNHVSEDELSVCLPINEKRANCIEKARSEFLKITRYFEKEISETLVLYQKVGVNENGEGKFEKIAGCIVRKGNREVIEFTPEAITS